MFGIKAPAKINWFLRVTGKRDDGFHDVLTLMQRISIYDTLIFERSDRLHVTTNAEISEESNLVTRAARMFASRFGLSPDVHIHVEKTIPMGAGLGGGSSDAAATLAGMAELFEIAAGADEMHEMAASLGSDVPFFLGAHTMALASGRGEKLEFLGNPPRMDLVIAKPGGVSVSTAWAYGSLKKLSKKAEARRHAIEEVFSGLSPEGQGRCRKALARFVENDFEHHVFEAYPTIGGLKDAMVANGAVAAGMSGSGSAVFGVFPDAEQADAAVLSLQGRQDLLGEGSFVQTAVTLQGS